MALCPALTLLQRAGAPGLAAPCLSFPLSSVRVIVEGREYVFAHRGSPPGRLHRGRCAHRWGAPLPRLGVGVGVGS